MFKLFKYVGWIFLGMMFAPKKGVELRSDLVDYLKKYRPQIKKFINNLEEVWEKSQGNESDEVTANLELKLNQVKAASDELDAAKTKELAYKALQKIGQAAISFGKSASKSKNVQSIAKDLAVITVEAIDKAEDVYSKVKDVSTSLSENVYEDSDEEKAIKADEIGIADKKISINKENKKVIDKKQ